MNARSARGLVTTNNVLEYCDTAFDTLLDEVQFLLDDETVDLPTTGASKENVQKLIYLLSYYGNQRSYFLGLWGKLRYNAGTDKPRIAARDFLDAAYTTAKDKYEASSRLLTAYQTLMEKD